MYICIYTYICMYIHMHNIHIHKHTHINGPQERELVELHMVKHFLYKLNAMYVTPWDTKNESLYDSYPLPCISERCILLPSLVQSLVYGNDLGKREIVSIPGAFWYSDADFIPYYLTEFIYQIS